MEAGWWYKNGGHQEVSAYLVPQVFGWGIVPQTWLRDGPLREGMVQLWQEQDPDQFAVNLTAADHMPETSWKTVLTGQDGNGGMVALIHEHTPALRNVWLCSTSSSTRATTSVP